MWVFSDQVQWVVVRPENRELVPAFSQPPHNRLNDNSVAHVRVGHHEDALGANESRGIFDDVED